MTPNLRPCGVPECKICRFNIPGEPPDSGHPDESLAHYLVQLALATIFFLSLFVLAFVLLPVLAA